jgi:hypothetical protein
MIRNQSRNQRSRAWQSMRILRRFKLSEIVATAEISANNCAKYIRALRQAGYLRVACAHHQGKAGGGAVYQLAKDTGPAAPLEKDGFMFDPNTGEVIDYA